MVKVNGMSQAALGRALALSGAAITKLKKQGMPVHSIEAAQAWRIARQNIARRKSLPGMTVTPASPPPKVDEPMDDETHDQARTRREIAEANLAELKLDELRAELVRASDVRQRCEQVAAAISSAIDQVSGRLAPVVASITSALGCHEAIEAECDNLRRQMVVGLTRMAP